MALSASECSSQTEDRIERMADHFESTMEDFEDSMEVLEDMMEDLGDYFADHDVTFNCDNYSYVVKGKKGGKKITISKKDALVTFKFPVANFNAIDAGHSFQVVMCDTVDSIVVRVNEKLKNHLNVRYNSGTLHQRRRPMRICVYTLQSAAFKDNPERNCIFFDIVANQHN